MLYDVELQSPLEKPATSFISRPLETLHDKGTFYIPRVTLYVPTEGWAHDCTL